MTRHARVSHEPPRPLNQSFQLGRVFGINIRVHTACLFLIAVVLLQHAGNPAQGLVFIATFASTVLLHELGHGLMAKHLGVHVIDIVFMPYGGMARMREIPQDWRIESKIAIAGPAVNLALAAITLPIVLILGTEAMLGQAARFFMVVNVALGLFNLIPAFPLDGARVMRALASRKSDWVAATEKTAALGRSFASFVAFGGIAIGLAYLNVMGCFACFLIAGFLWWASTQEMIAVRMRNMRSAFEGAGSQGGAPFSPFGSFAKGPAAPPAGETPVEQSSTPGGFSQADIDDLENFRGSLRGRKSDS